MFKFTINHYWFRQWLSDKPLPESMMAQFSDAYPICVISWLTHWGRVTHICVGKLTAIGSDNGLSPGRRQAIIWTNAGVMLIPPLMTNVSFNRNSNIFIKKKCVWKCPLRNDDHFVSTSMCWCRGDVQLYKCRGMWRDLVSHFQL